MIALAVAGIVLGLLPLIAGAVVLCLNDWRAFVFALTTAAVVTGGLYLAGQGISYLAGAA